MSLSLHLLLGILRVFIITGLIAFNDLDECNGDVDRVSVGLTSCSCGVQYCKSSFPGGKGKESAFLVTQMTSPSDIGQELLSDGLFQWLE